MLASLSLEFRNFRLLIKIWYFLKLLDALARILLPTAKSCQIVSYNDCHWLFLWQKSKGCPLLSFKFLKQWFTERLIVKAGPGWS